MFYQRKHIRLRQFDYSSPNAYFITVCVHHFLPVLGCIEHGICGLSAIGCQTAANLQNLPDHYPHIQVDEFIVMPNHFHCLLVISKESHPWTGNSFSKTVAGSVSTVIGHAKGAVTKWCKEQSLEFHWQGRFYDHVIRNNEEYIAIKNYIANNPQNWA